MKEKKSFTRREFVRNGIILLAGVRFAPAFLGQTLKAMELSGKGPLSAEGHILVVVQLGGGNDGLNTVIPYRMAPYYRSRRRLAIPKDRVLRLDDTVGFHPELQDLKALYDEGLVSIVQGVGYPNPSRSHFRAMDIWHTASPESRGTSTGWLGRFLDRVCPDCSPAVQGIQFGFSRNLALEGERNHVTTLLDSHLMGWQPVAHEMHERLIEQQTFMNLLNDSEPLGESAYVTHVIMDMVASTAEVKKASQRGRPGAEYPPTSFGRQLRTTASLILGGMPSMIYYTHLDGFDTHVNQQGRHDRLLRELGAGLRAFFEDLKNSVYRSKVIVLVFSEFGRRVEENASGGTDHGTVNPVLLLGDGLQPGIYGEHPSLERDDLDDIGDPKYRLDFRSVYATVLEDWFGTDSTPILGQAYSKIPVIKRET